VVFSIICINIPLFIISSKILCDLTALGIPSGLFLLEITHHCSSPSGTGAFNGSGGATNGSNGTTNGSGGATNGSSGFSPMIRVTFNNDGTPSGFITRTNGSITSFDFVTNSRNENSIFTQY
jgi:hypothetical protein